MNGFICVSVLLVLVFVFVFVFVCFGRGPCSSCKSSNTFSIFCLSYLLLLVLSCLSVTSVFLCLFFDRGCVFQTMEGAQDASDFASSLSSFFEAVVVVVRDRVVVRLLFFCGCSTTRQNIVEVVVEVIC